MSKFEQVITQLGVGEALISFLDKDGVPGIVEKAYILPPKSKIGPVSDLEFLKQYIDGSYIRPKYQDSVDRYLAYEMLTKKAESRQTGSEASTKEKAAKAKTAKKKNRFSSGSICKIGCIIDWKSAWKRTSLRFTWFLEKVR